MYAEIIINSDAVEVDRPFTYKVPYEMEKYLDIGFRVKVPFGIKNRPTEGFVYSIVNEDEVEISYKVKNILKICDKEAVLTRDDLKIIMFLRKKYLCKFIDAIRLMIPAGIMKGMTNKKKQVISIARTPLEDEIKKENYLKLYKFVLENNGKYTKTELSKENGFSLYSINKMIQNGIFKVEEQVIFRYNTRKYSSEERKNLTLEQQNAINTIIYGKHSK